MTGIESLGRLLAVHEIKSLQARRVQAVNKQDWDTYRARYTEDFISKVCTASTK